MGGRLKANNRKGLGRRESESKPHQLIRRHVEIAVRKIRALQTAHESDTEKRERKNANQHSNATPTQIPSPTQEQIRTEQQKKAARAEQEEGAPGGSGNGDGGLREKDWAPSSLPEEANPPAQPPRDLQGEQGPRTGPSARSMNLWDLARERGKGEDNPCWGNPAILETKQASMGRGQDP
jgi:hypothetical protein